MSHSVLNEVYNTSKYQEVRKCPLVAHVESHLASNLPRVNVQKLLTREHSSRMCTARFSSSWGGGSTQPTPLDADPKASAPP